MSAALPPFDAAGFPARLEQVRERIDRATDDPGSVVMVAVTKGFAVDAVTQALEAGISDIGENYADELVKKAAALESSPGTGPTWHFLGAIQRNKVARLSPLVSWWQGVSRLEEGRAIARRRPSAQLLVEVDVTGRAGRGGCPPGRVPELVKALVDEGMEVAGLMAVGRQGPPEAARPDFALVSSLADSLDLGVRSMGMSDDLEVAISEGSTMVRLGRALFGPRLPRP
jgi:PLP dependent protein